MVKNEKENRWTPRFWPPFSFFFFSWCYADVSGNNIVSWERAPADINHSSKNKMIRNRVDSRVQYVWRLRVMGSCPRFLFSSPTAFPERSVYVTCTLPNASQWVSINTSCSYCGSWKTFPWPLHRCVPWPFFILHTSYLLGSTLPTFNTRAFPLHFFEFHTSNQAFSSTLCDPASLDTFSPYSSSFLYLPVGFFVMPVCFPAPPPNPSLSQRTTQPCHTV